MESNIDPFRVKSLFCLVVSHNDASQADPAQISNVIGQGQGPQMLKYAEILAYILS
jgi:hypothetical protein